MTSPLRDRILARLEADPKAESPWDVLVLVALEGPEALSAALSAQATPEKPSRTTPQDAPAPEPRGAYLKAIAVEGFRGVGPKARLELPPGPGLTLVVGRNGSGKSSFAEALELLLTGDTFRWKKRTKVWREGWRNLHHKPAAIEAEFHIEGEKGLGLVARRWADDAELDDGVTTVQVQGKPRTDLASLGWEGPLDTYRPFLSYNELGSMLDEGPSKLYDALSSILGLVELTDAQAVLAEARKARDRAHKEAWEKRTQILALLENMDDDRARALVMALQQKDWGLDEAEAVLGQAAAGTAAEGDLALLRQLASLQTLNPEAVAAVAKELREADQRQQAAAGTLASRSKDLADILDLALRFHDQHGDADCPVCGKPRALDKSWHEHRKQETRTLRDAAREATTAQQAVESARARAQQLPVPPAGLLARAPEVGLDAQPAAQALEHWTRGFQSLPLSAGETGRVREPADVQSSPLPAGERDRVRGAVDLELLAAHLESSSGPLSSAIAVVREAAQAELQRRVNTWKPVAQVVGPWIPEARQARTGHEAIKPLKSAESWLKQAATEIRTERFEPIKARAQAIWNQLRLQSNVALDDIRLSGSATKRQVELDVSVDGVEGAALGVMSQGELHGLALSLFIPRATLSESPFRFVVIDDPVQSMDPARVDGLARVLESAAKDRQVVVFTHDDRLVEAVRRLQIAGTVVEVTRRENSVVQLRPGKDSVARYIEDAMTLARTDDLPQQAARRVIPGLCRLALDAACMEAVRRRRLGRGERHADVEELLEHAGKTTTRVALALFDDAERGKDVLPRLDKEARESADTLRWCNEGAHEEQAGAMMDHIRRTERLAARLRSQA